MAYEKVNAIDRCFVLLHGGNTTWPSGVGYGCIFDQGGGGHVRVGENHHRRLGENQDGGDQGQPRPGVQGSPDLGPTGRLGIRQGGQGRFRHPQT